MWRMGGKGGIWGGDREDDGRRKECKAVPGASVASQISDIRIMSDISKGKLKFILWLLK